MANVSPWLANAILDWAAGGATPTRPAARFVGFSLDNPTSTSFNEIGAGSGYARQSAVFAPATSGHVVNAATLAFAPFSSAAVLSGLVVCDAAVGGNLLWFGPITPARTSLAGDAPLLAVGAIAVSIS